MRVSLIVTVRHEQATINLLLAAIDRQSRRPDEVVIVDAGSTDKTVQLIKVFAQAHPQLHLRWFIKEGNRSVGRNFAIQQAKYDWIAITDAGCIPHDDWLAQLLAVAKDKQTVVAGYYDAKPHTPFEAAVVPYVLVMPDRVNPHTFLPATRSMLIHRSIWRQVGGFDEQLDVSEDYALAHKLITQAKVNIVFTDKAKVSWLPRQNLGEFFQMVVSMAEGDVRGGLMRGKAMLVFARYLAVVITFYLIARVSWQLTIGYWLVMIGCYLGWSIQKNLHYVPRGWYWLPILQIAADVGVIWGTIRGSFHQS